MFIQGIYSHRKGESLRIVAGLLKRANYSNRIETASSRKGAIETIKHTER